LPLCADAHASIYVSLDSFNSKRVRECRKKLIKRCSEKRELYRNKSVFSYLRTLITWHCPSPLQQSIDISCLPSAQQQTRRTLLQLANGTDRRADRRTDIVPFRRPCYAYYAISDNKRSRRWKAGVCLRDFAERSLAYKFYGDLKCDRVAVVGVKARAVCGCATPSPATDRWVNRDLHFYASSLRHTCCCCCCW